MRKDVVGFLAYSLLAFGLLAATPRPAQAVNIDIHVNAGGHVVYGSTGLPATNFDMIILVWWRDDANNQQLTEYPVTTDAYGNWGISDVVGNGPSTQTIDVACYANTTGWHVQPAGVGHGYSGASIQCSTTYLAPD